jgi:hypothetical protein
MSQTTSPSTGKSSGLARVCRVWGVARSPLYWQRHGASAPSARRGPVGPCADDELVAHLRRILETSLFPGEGYRKVWARLRHTGIRTSPRRVLRLMRAHHLLAPTRQGHPHGPTAHDGTIIPPYVATMWGTDMTATYTRQDGAGGDLYCGGSLLGQSVWASTRLRRGPGLKRWNPFAKASVPPLGLLSRVAPKAWHSDMIMAVNICRMCFRRNCGFWGSPAHRPLSVNPRATAVRNAHPDPEGESVMAYNL